MIQQNSKNMNQSLNSQISDGGHPRFPFVARNIETDKSNI